MKKKNIRCRAITATGEQCFRMISADSGTGLCKQHLKLEVKKAITDSKSPKGH